MSADGTPWENPARRRLLGGSLALLAQLPLLSLLHPFSPWPAQQPALLTWHDTPLQLNLQPSIHPLQLAATRPTRPHTPPAPRPSLQQRGHARSQDPSVTASRRMPRPPAALPAPVYRPPAEPSVAPAPTATGYIPGGGMFAPQQPGSYQRDALQLPGVAQIAHAPHFAMQASEQQGLAHRIIGVIGSLGHAVDPHCLDVAVWNGMSPQEQIAHHTSRQQIAAYTERYHCVPPPRY